MRVGSACKFDPVEVRLIPNEGLKPLRGQRSFCSSAVEVRLIPNEGLKPCPGWPWTASSEVEVRLIPNEGLKHLFGQSGRYPVELKYDSSRTRD